MQWIDLSDCVECAGYVADGSGMGRARDQRKRETRKQVDPLLDTRRRLKQLLGKLGLLGLFESMPACYRDQFYAACWPAPKLVFDPSFPAPDAFGGAYASLHEQVCAGFKRATIELDGLDLSVGDFWSIALPIMSMARSTLRMMNSPLRDTPRPPGALRTFLEQAVPPLVMLCRQDVLQESHNALHREVLVPMVARSRLDGRLLHARLSMLELPRKQRLVMTLYAEQAPVKQVRLGNWPRTVHQVGTANVWNGIEWATWSRATVKGQWADQLGLTDGESWSVYVQGRALDRLRSRLDTYAHADWGEHWMYESLKTPKIVASAPGGDLLVAYEVMGMRLGYLVVSVRERMVVVRTFLFLTMRNTPEGRELAKRLKLTRDEMEYLRLHELSRFTRTDLKDDAELRRIFKHCGCGHLFKLAEDEDAMTPGTSEVRPFAAELREYVRLAA